MAIQKGWRVVFDRGDEVVVEDERGDAIGESRRNWNERSSVANWFEAFSQALGVNVIEKK